jgi:mRNA interferase RelE/StbE
LRYELFFEEKAFKEFKKIDRPYQKLIKKKLDLLAENYNTLKNKLKPLKGKYEYYRLRVGNYRIIFNKDDEKLIIVIVRIGHRKEIYR